MGQTEMDKEGTLFQTRQTLAWEDGTFHRPKLFVYWQFGVMFLGWMTGAG